MYRKDDDANGDDGGIEGASRSEKADRQSIDQIRQSSYFTSTFAPHLLKGLLVLSNSFSHPLVLLCLLSTPPKGFSSDLVRNRIRNCTIISHVSHQSFFRNTPQ